MQRLRHHAVIGYHYVLQALKMRLEYRFDFIVECVAALLQQAAGLLMLEFLFQKFSSMKGWTREDVFFIYGFSLIPMALFEAFAMSFYMFSDKYIVGGELDRVLLRPLSSLFQLLMEGFDFEFIANLTLGLAILTYAWHHVGPPVTVGLLLQLALGVFGAFGVLFGVFLSLTALSFWSQDRTTFVPPIYNLLNFARYPLDIYKPFIRILLTYVVPFGFVAFYPSATFLAKGEAFRDFSVAVPLVGILMTGIGCYLWRLGVRHYSGAGS